jgi:hypothetical protein
MGERSLMGGTQKHAGRLVCLECFLPSGRTQAPTVARLEACKAVFRHWSRQIIPKRFGKFEKPGSSTVRYRSRPSSRYFVIPLAGAKPSGIAPILAPQENSPESNVNTRLAAAGVRVPIFRWNCATSPLVRSRARFVPNSGRMWSRKYASYSTAVRDLRIGRTSSLIYLSASSAMVGARRSAARSAATSSPSRARAKISCAVWRAASAVIVDVAPRVIRLLAVRRPPKCGRYSTIQLFAPVGVTRHPNPDKLAS